MRDHRDELGTVNRNSEQAECQLNFVHVFKRKT